MTTTPATITAAIDRLRELLASHPDPTYDALRRVVECYHPKEETQVSAPYVFVLCPRCEHEWLAHRETPHLRSRAAYWESACARDPGVLAGALGYACKDLPLPYGDDLAAALAICDALEFLQPAGLTEGKR